MLLLTLLLIVAIGQQVSRYAQRVMEGIAPTVLAELEKRLDRRVRYERLRLERPGLAVVEGLRVARGLGPEEAEFFSARRVELRFDPGLQRWSSLFTRGLGHDTRARLVVQDVKVFQRDGTPLLAAAAASTRFDLAPVLAGKGDVLATITPVIVEKAHLRIRRDRRGKWNYEDLLPKRKKEKPHQFRSTIIAPDARIDLWNERAGRLQGVQHSQYRGAARIGFGAHPTLQFALDGELTDGPVARGIRRPLSVEGHADTDKGTWQITAKVSTDRAQYWYDYVSAARTDAFRIRHGVVRAAVTAWSHAKGKPPEYQATLAVSGGEAQLKAFAHPLTDIRGQVVLNGSAVVIDGSLRVSGLPVSATGEISLVPALQTRLRVQAEEVTTAWVRKTFPEVKLPDALDLPQTVRMRASLLGTDAGWSFEGTARTPTVLQVDAEGKTLTTLEWVDATYHGVYRQGAPLQVDGEVRAQEGQVRDVSVRGLRADFHLREKWLQLAVVGQALDGTVGGKGWIDLAKSPAEFYAVGEARNLRPEMWPQPEARTRISGGVSAQLTASGTLEAPEISAYVEAGPLNLGDEHLDRITGRVIYEAGDLRIPYAVVEQRGQQATLTGTVAQGGELSLDIAGRGLSVESLLAGRSEEKISGEAYVAARVTGTAGKPRIVGRLQVYRPVLARRPDLEADYAEAAFDWDGADFLRLTDVVLERAPVSLRTGTLELTRLREEAQSQEADAGWRVRSRVHVEGLSLTHALRLGGVSMERLRDAPLSGSLDSLSFDVDGPLDAPQLTFDVRGTRVAFQQFDLGDVRATGKVDLARSTVEVSNLNVASTQLHGEGSGRLAWEPDARPDDRSNRTRLDLRLTLGGVRLGPLVERFAPDVEAYATVSATLEKAAVRVTGTVEDPQLEGEITLAGLILNERAVPLEPFRFQWNQQLSVLRNLDARLGSGHLRVPYLVAWLEGRKHGKHLLDWLAGRVEVDAVPVAVIEQLVQDSPYYNRKSLDALREALDQWTTPIAGRVNAVLAAPVGDGPLPATLVGVGSAMRTRGLPPVVTGEISVPDLASPPESDAPLIRLTSHFNYRPGRLEVADFSLTQEPETTLSLSGILVEPSGDDPGTLNASMRGEKLKVSSLARLPIRGLEERLKGIQPLDGLAGFTMVASGSFRLPRLKLNVAVDKPLLSGVPFDELTLEGAEYSAEEGILRATSARLVKRLPSGESQVRVVGSLPLTWPKLIVPADARRELTVLVPEQSLSVLNELAAESETLAAERGGENPGRMAPVVSALRQIAATRGRMEGRITLGGTREAPANDGFFRLVDATLRVEGLETEIRDVNVRVDLLGDQLELTQLSGKSNHGGTIGGSGSVTFGAAPGVPAPARLDIRLSVDQFKFVEKKVGSLLGEAFKGTQTRGVLQSVSRTAVKEPAAIHITGDLQRPTIVGAIRLDASSTMLAYAPVYSEQRVGEPGGPNLDLQLIIGENVWLRNPQARLKLGEGVRVTQTVGAPVVTGEIRVLEGTIPLPGLRLRHVEGVLRIAYDGRGQGTGAEGRTSLFVDLTAASTVRLHRSVALEAEDYELEFVIRGTPGTGGEGSIRPAGVTGGLLLGGDGGLTITVRTDPPLPAGEIEALIRQHFGVEGFGGSGSNVVEALRTQIEQAIAANLSSALTGRIEDALQSALGLSVFAIDVGVSQPLRIRLGRQLFGKLYGTVTQQFGSAEGDNPTRYEVYYRLTPRVRVGYRQEEPLGLRVFFFSGGISF